MESTLDWYKDVLAPLPENEKERLFGYLISIANKFTSKNSIDINLITVKDTMVFSIKDSGVGMSARIIKELFSGKENIIKNETEGEPVTIIGLPLVKRFVDLHLGTISCSSKPKYGAKFIVPIPQ